MHLIISIWITRACESCVGNPVPGKNGGFAVCNHQIDHRVSFLVTFTHFSKSKISTLSIENNFLITYLLRYFNWLEQYVMYKFSLLHITTLCFGIACICSNSFSIKTISIYRLWSMPIRFRILKQRR